MKKHKTQVGKNNPKLWRMNKYWPWILCVSTLLIIGITGQSANYISNSPKRQMNESTIDSCLQAKVDLLLRHQMEIIHAISGQVIVMEVATGKLRSLVGLGRKSDGTYEANCDWGFQQESGLVRIASALALLDESKASLDTHISTGEGMYEYDGKRILDSSFYRGGYGVLTMEQVLQYGSNVGMAKLAINAYEKQPQAFFDKLDKMSFGKPDTLLDIPNLHSIQCIPSKENHCKRINWAFSAIGYEQGITPMQMLTFFNAIANDGKMVKPQLHHRPAIVINSQIAQTESIRRIQKVLRSIVYEGYGRKANTRNVRVAGSPGTVQTTRRMGEDFEYHVEFCGFFPVQHPKYSIIVSMNKIGRPSSGSGQASPVFRQIVEYMMQKHD